MRAVIQRVKSASVTVDNELISTIGKGLLILAAVAKDDGPEDCEKVARDVLKAKLWDDPSTGAKWKKNVVDIGGEVLCVSQFTLMATSKKGHPSFHRSAAPEKAKTLYDHFLKTIKAAYQEDKIKDGCFQAMMDVALVNDGPVGTAQSPDDTADETMDDGDRMNPNSMRGSDAKTSHQGSQQGAGESSPAWFPKLPELGVNFESIDEAVTIQIDTDPPKADLQSIDAAAIEAQIRRTFETHAELLE